MKDSQLEIFSGKYSTSKVREEEIDWTPQLRRQSMRLK